MAVAQPAAQPQPSSQSQSQPQPLSREALFRNIGPLVGAAFLGLLSFAVARSDPISGLILIQAATLATLTVAVMVILPWHRLPEVVQVGPALAYVLIALLIRQATGGPTSIYAQLVLVPILWLAVYGSFSEVAAGVSTVGVALLATVLLTPDPQGAMTSALMLAVFAALVGFGVQQLFAYLRLHAATLDMLARTDPLTGANNRRAWEEQLIRSLGQAERHRTPVCAALIDLDHFKEFNDEHGHQAGDRLLKSVTARWRGQLRDGDVLARMGGDEFAILLPGCPLDAAQRILERLVDGLPDGQTCSTGLAFWNGLEDCSQFLARADQALYSAKDAGRNRIFVA